ncbi:MAG: AAA family ATPase, partial [Methylocapsa sp.]|nr:AAA family ATPase [Methylocapsa sp.]
QDTEFQPAGAVWARPSTWLRDHGPVSVDYLRRHLSVVRELHSRVISVEYSSSDPKKAATAANRIVAAFTESHDVQKRDELERELAQLDKQIPEAKDELERAESLLRAYRNAHGIAEPNQTDQINQQLAALTSQLALAKSDSYGHPAQQPGRQFLPGQSESRDSILQDADGIGHDARIRAIQRRLAIVQSAKKQVDAAEIPMRELARQEAASLEHYNEMLRHQNELREQMAMAVPDIHVISAAVPPVQPSSPNPLLFIFPALVFSAAAGTLIALAAERLDRGLRSEREVEDALGIPCIGLVPELHRNAKDRPHHQLRVEPFGVYTEAIRSTVAAALRLGSLNGDTKTILVTSSVPREGKTTLAVSFAVYAALLRPRVILVDFDFRHPATLRELSGEIERNPGACVFDLFSRGRPVEEAIQRIPGTSLDYLPVGGRPVDPLHLFAREEIRSLLSHLRENYDCVVIDSPPLLAVTEARLLASMADKILFVVQWGNTRRELAQSAMNFLRNPGLLEKDCSICARAVVTQVNLKKHALYRYGDSGECYVKYRKIYS